MTRAPHAAWRSRTGARVSPQFTTTNEDVFRQPARAVQPTMQRDQKVVRLWYHCVHRSAQCPRNPLLHPAGAPPPHTRAHSLLSAASLTSARPLLSTTLPPSTRATNTTSSNPSSFTPVFHRSITSCTALRPSVYLLQHRAPGWEQRSLRIMYAPYRRESQGSRTAPGSAAAAPGHCHRTSSAPHAPPYSTSTARAE